MVEMEVLDFTSISPPAEGADKGVGNACYTGKVDMVTASDYLYRLVGGDEFFLHFFL